MDHSKQIHSPDLIVLYAESRGQYNDTYHQKQEKVMDHLDKLEAEAIYIMREVAAECEKPVMLYSIGKDSSVMLHLALKAFYPEKPPFPFLHVNTTWKFNRF